MAKTGAKISSVQMNNIVSGKDFLKWKMSIV